MTETAEDFARRVCDRPSPLIDAVIVAIEARDAEIRRGAMEEAAAIVNEKRGESFDLRSIVAEIRDAIPGTPRVESATPAAKEEDRSNG